MGLYLLFRRPLKTIFMMPDLELLLSCERDITSPTASSGDNVFPYDLMDEETKTLQGKLESMMRKLWAGKTSFPRIEVMEVRTEGGRNGKAQGEHVGDLYPFRKFASVRGEITSGFSFLRTTTISTFVLFDNVIFHFVSVSCGKIDVVGLLLFRLPAFTTPLARNLKKQNIPLPLYLNHPLYINPPP